MELFAEVEVNVPGVMAMLVAPLVAQLSVLLEPELMLAGAAEKDVTVGTGPFPELTLAPPHANSPMQAATMTRTETADCEELSPRQPTFFLQRVSVDSIGDPSTFLANPCTRNGPRPLD